jgi:hypothetical protein
MFTINRRRFERFALSPMYTPVAVRLLADDAYEFEGHAYDVSEGGLRFELDYPIEPGTPVAVTVLLPGHGPESSRSVCVYANVIWVENDEDEPGPVRMAAAFTKFARAEDKERLLGLLGSGRVARAA